MTQAKWVLVCILCMLPSLTEAAVSISEIAWMGSVESANHEWIELYNDGAAVDVSGWVLTDSMNLEITLEGVLPSGYQVLERTSDASAAGTAWQIYTGALVNTGATLQLRDTNEVLVDQVAGGDSWQDIGGDNVTKETAQYTSAGWMTAVSTPGRESAGYTAEPEAAETSGVSDDNTDTKTIKTSDKSNGPVRLVLPDVTLAVAIDAQTIGYVNQSILFSADGSKVGDTILDSLTYDWNFGDGFTDTGQEVSHTFKYPGTYVVTVYASYKRQEQVARHEITILPVTTSLTLNQAGDVQLHNESPYEIDVSGYRIVGEDTFEFAERSIMLPNQTVTIPRDLLGDTKNRLLALYDTSDVLVSSRAPSGVLHTPAPSVQYAVNSAAPQQQLLSNERTVVGSTVSAVETNPRFSFATDNGTEDDLIEIGQVASMTVSPIATASGLAGAAVAAPASLADTHRSYILLTTLLLAVIAGIYLSPNRNQNS